MDKPEKCYICGGSDFWQYKEIPEGFIRESNPEEWVCNKCHPLPLNENERKEE